MLSPAQQKSSFRADQVGSFLRPLDLLECRERFRRGEASLEILRAKEDEAVHRLLRMQEEVGLSVYSDGEVRREAWYSDFNEAVDGLEMVEGARTTSLVWYDVDGKKHRPLAGATAEAAVRKIKTKRRIAAHESGFLARHAPGPFKITLPSPVSITGFIYRAPASSAAYPKKSDLLADVTSIIRQELRDLSDEGVPYVQVDEGFTRMVSQGWAERVKAAGGNPEEEIAEAIAVENECYAAVDRTRVTLGMHICRGNSRSRWVHQGGYDAIAERVFRELDVDRFLLEYDTNRAGTFEPLRFVPKEKSSYSV
jgi:5-methyltetrahydropteroyltriglutamate--homocysteine methyltransferase